MLFFLPQPRGQLPALMGTFGWLMGGLYPKAGWRSASMGDGGQCVMTLGEPKKLGWSADSRGTQLKVGACLSVCLSVCLSAPHLSVSVCLSAPHLSVSVCLSVCLSAPHLSVCTTPVCLCLCLSMCKLISRMDHTTDFIAGAVALISASFGQGADPIFLDNMACVGTETFLRNCPNSGIGIHNCRHAEDASVVCPGEASVVGGGWRRGAGRVGGRRGAGRVGGRRGAGRVGGRGRWERGGDMGRCSSSVAMSLR